MYGAGRLKGFIVKANLHQFIVLFEREALMKYLRLHNYEKTETLTRESSENHSIKNDTRSKNSRV